MATITLPVRALVRLLNTAAIFAGTDETIPMLCCIKLERHGDELVAAGTDRFRLGINTVTAVFEDVADDFNIMVNRDDVALIARSFGKESNQARAILTVGDEGVEVLVPGNPVRLVLPYLDMEFPKWRQLFTGTYGEVSPGVMLDSDYLQDFTKAKRAKDHGVRVLFPESANRPVRVLIRDYFVGIIMPIRQAGGDLEILERLGIDA